MFTAADSLAWAEPPARPTLDPGAVHLWRIPLDADAEPPPGLAAALNADERARADRFYFARDRRAFIRARGALRHILGGYVDTAAAAVRFVYNDCGKPFLAADPGPPAVQFNLSHSGDVALLAVTHGRLIGVDVERVGDRENLMDLATRFFAAGEVASLRSLPAADRAHGFFRGWTRKEAYIKARGEGLSIPLDGFEVSLAGDSPARLRRADGDDPSRWTLVHLPVQPGYVGALAIENAPDAAVEFRVAKFNFQIYPCG